MSVFFGLIGPVAGKVLHLSHDGPVIVMTGHGSSPSSGNRLGSSAFVNAPSKVVSGRPSVIEFEIGRIYFGCSSYRSRVSKLATNTPARATIPSRVALIRILIAYHVVARPTTAQPTGMRNAWPASSVGLAKGASSACLSFSVTLNSNRL